MQTVLTVIVSWLSINLGLPASSDHPRIELVSPVKMAALRYSRLTADRSPTTMIEAGRAAPPSLGREVYALYDDNKRVIYLHEGWTGETPAEISILVHEMVHHLQNVANKKFACPQEREKDAYEAQVAWLQLFRRTLEQDFDIDPMAIIVRTNCGP